LIVGLDGGLDLTGPLILTKWDDLNAVQLTVFQDLSKTNLSLDDVVTQ